ncbi:XdhC family protein [Microbacterium sp. ZW T2_14]|uniref:XdhC family protein n=1 Tax=Microbacterium sp. ZW T2_14 TaxID=3378079 RepID=UPI00385536C8
MLERARELLPLLRDGVAVAAVTVTGVARSAPRGAGATMAVTADGRVIGSISGGCVEGDAILLAHGARRDGAPRTARLGFSDDAAHAAGLACGGSVDVAAYAVRPEPSVIEALEAAAAGHGITVGLVLAGPVAGTMLDERALRSAIAGSSESAGALDAAIRDRDTVVLTGALDGRDVLVLSHAPASRLIVIGAGEHAAALCRVATAAGFAVTVCDVWETLVTRERFPAAVELVVGLPHEHLAALDASVVDDRTAVCVLTHDERLDVPALAAALALPVGFVGAMGARGTVAHRTALLREAGVPAADIARVRSPLGLDLGGASPEETAISVLAEIIATRHGGSGLPLSTRSGSLHRRRAAAAPHTAESPSGEAPSNETSADATISAAPAPQSPAARETSGCSIRLPSGAP